MGKFTKSIYLEIAVLCNSYPNFLLTKIPTLLDMLNFFMSGDNIAQLISHGHMPGVFIA